MLILYFHHIFFIFNCHWHDAYARNSASAQKSFELKMDQYQHRCQFLEEQMTDLEQQMSSLYAAFGIVQDDTWEERNKTEAWKRTMLESDAALAQEQSKKEMEQQHTCANGGDGARDEQGAKLCPASASPGPSSSPSRPPVEPEHPPIAKGALLLLLDRNGQPLPPNHVPADTPRSKGKRLSFKLSKSPSSNKHGNSVFKFKKQQCVLHGSNGLYQLRYGDTLAGAVSGVLEFITAGYSSIAVRKPSSLPSCDAVMPYSHFSLPVLQHTPRSSGLPFGFEIMINESHVDAPVLCCAAETEEDFLMWMTALTSVMDGSMESQQEDGNLNH